MRLLCSHSSRAAPAPAAAAPATLVATPACMTASLTRASFSKRGYASRCHSPPLSPGWAVWEGQAKTRVGTARCYWKWLLHPGRGHEIMVETMVDTHEQDQEVGWCRGNCGLGWAPAVRRFRQSEGGRSAALPGMSLCTPVVTRQASNGSEQAVNRQ